MADYEKLGLFYLGRTVDSDVIDVLLTWMVNGAVVSCESFTKRRPRADSNCALRLRRPTLCPLSYGGGRRNFIILCR